MYLNSADIVLRRVRLDGTDGAPIPATAGAPTWKQWVLMKSYSKQKRMVWAGSGETDLPFGLTTPPTQPPDEMSANAVSLRPLPIIPPPQIFRFDLKPYHLNYPPAALPRSTKKHEIRPPAVR